MYTNRNLNLANMHKYKNCVHVCVCIVVHNCCTQHSTEQFWLSSLLSTTQAPELRCCLLEGRGRSRGVESQKSSNETRDTQRRRVECIFCDVQTPSYKAQNDDNWHKNVDNWQNYFSDWKL